MTEWDIEHGETLLSNAKEQAEACVRTYWLKETRSERDTCTPMFITALFIKARTWKQPRCPSACTFQGWNRSPAQVGCMRQVLGPGALGRSRGIGWRGRWEGGSGGGIHVNPWLIHVNVWQKPLQYCKVLSLQLIKINGKKKEHQLQIVPKV